MTIRLLPIANDNNQPRFLPEFMFWQKKCYGFSRYPKSLLKTEFKLRDRMLLNFIQFFKFEVSWREKQRMETRKNLSVIR